MSFQLPEIIDNPNGFGPVGLNAQFRDIPYAPYSKADRLGKIADWSAPEGAQGGAKDQRDNQRGGRSGFRNARDNYVPFGSNAANAFNYQHTEDEASFSVVDNRSGAKKTVANKSASAQRSTRGGFRQQGQQRNQFQRLGGNRAGFGVSRQQQAGGGPGGARGGRRGYGNWRDFDRNQRVRDASVKVGPEWNMLEEIEFSRLNKLQFEVEEPENISLHGSVGTYDRAYDRVNTKAERFLQQSDRERDIVTTSDDPILNDLASKPGREGEKRVFATDTIISVLMTASRSVYPWDIVINRVGDKVIFDTREGSQVDYVSVNENASDPPMDTGDKDNINSPSALSLEATFINTNFAAQVVKQDETVNLENGNPFYDAEDSSAPLVGYRYRQFDLSSTEEEDISLFVRTEFDGVVKAAGGEDSYITIKALNEFDSRAQGAGGAMDWRQKLDAQRGAVVATEMKNNSCKLARWIVQTMLVGADHLKLGYVSRSNPKDANRHAILGTQICRPKEFAQQMNLQFTNGWGIVKTVVDLALKLPEGKYVLVKDPNKPLIRLYSVPKSTFEQDNDEGDDEDAGADENTEA
ncbi:hypothetical protein DFQ27_008127 [Actinomortierella ambigua]|uniref:Eukaryotic translation initiation factor 3 subunit D n=1 Tax=Actinomortierella ambigua TaxID=1343610 RepID=A0A9P6QIF8_9FUNG|nr:hypothetical protein DFQ26_004536 [Actinomortierella ambigua]KAG0267851.1 hypothetical protein DFQ27_008127 [Actinomortierella ambigua]